MPTQVAPIVGPQARKSILAISKASVKKQLLSTEATEPRKAPAKSRNRKLPAGTDAPAGKPRRQKAAVEASATSPAQ